MILFDEDTNFKSYFCRPWALGVTVKILRQDCITVGAWGSSWQLTGVTKDLRFDRVGFPVAEAECWGCELEGCWAQLLAGQGLRGTLERLRKR